MILPVASSAFSPDFANVLLKDKTRVVAKTRSTAKDTTEDAKNQEVNDGENREAESSHKLGPPRDELWISPFEAMDRFFDDDLFAMSSRMMDRMDRLLTPSRSLFSPMPLLRDYGRDNSAILRRSSPAYEIREDDSHFELSIDLPGVRSEDCKVELEQEGRVLHLHGGRKIETESGYSETRFDQRFKLGKNLDVQNVSANLSDGVLVVTMPKIEVEESSKTRVIGITSNPHRHGMSAKAE